MITFTRNLPHFQPTGATFFITFRLSGTVPLIKLKELRFQYELQKRELYRSFGKDFDYEKKLYTLQKKHFLKYDKLLDTANYGPKWLEEESIAEVVYNKMLEFDTMKYELIVFTIMPNHVHLVMSPNSDLKISAANLDGKTKDYIVSDIMRLLKGSTARDSNLQLGRTGQFWHHESYDHVVRNQTELNNIVTYVLNNPVKAGLVENWKDWKWSYCSIEL